MDKDIIFNKPNLSYDKNYDTNGKYIGQFKPDDNLDEENILPEANKEDDIKDKLEDIKDKLPAIPNDILDVVIPPFIVIDKVVEDILDKLKDLPDIPDTEDPDVDEVIKPDIDVDFDEDDIPEDPFEKGPDIYVDIKVDEVQKDIILDKTYYDDLLDVFRDYLYNFDQTLLKYIINTVTTVNMSDHQKLNIIKTKDLKDKELSHLSDYLVKSKIILRQKLNLCKKMFDTNETIFQIRGVKAAFEQKKRYSLSKEMSDVGHLSKFSNDLLRESLLVSEKKYEENFLSLYKYLNSSVILLDECINIMIKQKDCLVVLNNKEREK